MIEEDDLFGGFMRQRFADTFHVLCVFQHIYYKNSNVAYTPDVALLVLHFVSDGILYQLEVGGDIDDRRLIRVDVDLGWGHGRITSLSPDHIVRDLSMQRTTKLCRALHRVRIQVSWGEKLLS